MKAHLLALSSVLAAGYANAQANMCSVCPNGLNANNTDSFLDDLFLGEIASRRTKPCSEIIRDASISATMSFDCAMAELAAESVCCPEWFAENANNANSCEFLCPDGTAIDGEKVPEYESGNANSYTCSSLANRARLYQANSSYCGFFLPIQEELCCLPTLSDTIPSVGNNRGKVPVMVIISAVAVVVVSLVAFLAVYFRRKRAHCAKGSPTTNPDGVLSTPEDASIPLPQYSLEAALYAQHAKLKHCEPGGI